MKCQICGHIHFRKKRFVNDVRFNMACNGFWILECRNCSTLLTTNKSNVVNPYHYYPKDYTAFISQDSEIPSPQIKSIKTKISKLLAKYCISLDRNSWMHYLNLDRRLKILDVGCGTGKIASFIKRQYGCSVVGIEPNLSAAQLAKNKGLEVFVGSLDTYNPTELFDIVILIHVLEHMTDPVVSLKRIYNIMKTNGKLVIAIPNIDGIEQNIFRSYWDGWDVPRHVHHFSPTSITYTIKKAGFQPAFLSHECYSLFSRSLCNIFFSELPYSERQKKINFHLAEKLWGFLQATFKVSSAIQIVADRN